jgi:hypothetical protein
MSKIKVNGIKPAERSFYRKLNNASVEANQDMEANRSHQNFTIVNSVGGVRDQEFGRGSLSPDRSPGARSPSIETEEIKMLTRRFS